MPEYHPGDALLDIEAKIGELLPTAEEAKGEKAWDTRRGVQPCLHQNERHARKAARAIHAHPEIVARVKAKARQKQGGVEKGIQKSGEPIRTDKVLAEAAGVSHNTLTKAEIPRAPGRDPAGTPPRSRQREKTASP